MRIVSRGSLPIVYAFERSDTGDVVFLDGVTVAEAVEAFVCLGDSHFVTTDELDALCDHEIFPVSCRTCRHGLNGHLVDLGNCACVECISGPDIGVDREGWEPRED